MTLKRIKEAITERFSNSIIPLHIVLIDIDFIEDDTWWGLVYVHDKSLSAEAYTEYQNGYVIKGCNDVWATADTPEQLADEFYRQIYKDYMGM